MHVVDPNSSWAINANGMAVRRSPEADDLAHVARGSTHAGGRAPPAAVGPHPARVRGRGAFFSFKFTNGPCLRWTSCCSALVPLTQDRGPGPTWLRDLGVDPLSMPVRNKGCDEFDGDSVLVEIPCRLR